MRDNKRCIAQQIITTIKKSDKSFVNQSFENYVATYRPVRLFFKNWDNHWKELSEHLDEIAQSLGGGCLNTLTGTNVRAIGLVREKWCFLTCFTAICGEGVLSLQGERLGERVRPSSSGVQFLKNWFAKSSARSAQVVPMGNSVSLLLSSEIRAFVFIHHAVRLPKKSHSRAIQLQWNHVHPKHGSYAMILCIAMRSYGCAHKIKLVEERSALTNGSCTNLVWIRGFIC